MDDEFIFEGFDSPTYTQVPDAVFDQLLPVLKEAELKVLLYIIRRTFGFKKTIDDISFTQFLKGITTSEGRVLDRGCGVKSSSTLNAALKSLEAKRIIVARRVTAPDGALKTTSYALHIRNADPLRIPHDPTANIEVPLLREPKYPTANSDEPLLRSPQGQETVEQQTERQETDSSNDSNDLPLVMSREDAERITWIVKDIAREFADQAPAKSSATRACNLYLESGLTLDSFLDVLQQARVRTKRYTGTIKADRLPNGDKPKMSYFFAVIEDLIGKRPLEQTG